MHFIPMLKWNVNILFLCPPSRLRSAHVGARTGRTNDETGGKWGSEALPRVEVWAKRYRVLGSISWVKSFPSQLWLWPMSFLILFTSSSQPEPLFLPTPRCLYPRWHSSLAKHEQDQSSRFSPLALKQGHSSLRSSQSFEHWWGLRNTWVVEWFDSLLSLFSAFPPKHGKGNLVCTYMLTCMLTMNLAHKGLEWVLTSHKVWEKAFWAFFSLKELIAAPYRNAWRMNKVNVIRVLSTALGTE